MKYNNNCEVDQTILSKLQEILNEVNFYVQQFQMAANIFQSRPTEELCLKIKSKGSRDARRRTPMPDVSDVVVIAPGDQIEHRDIVLYKSRSMHPSRNDAIKINELNQAYD